MKTVKVQASAFAGLMNDHSQKLGRDFKNTFGNLNALNFVSVSERRLTISWANLLLKMLVGLFFVFENRCFS